MQHSSKGISSTSCLVLRMQRHHMQMGFTSIVVALWLHTADLRPSAFLNPALQPHPPADPDSPD